MKIPWLIFFLSILGSIVVWRAGYILSKPANILIGDAPAVLEAENIQYKNVSGWFSGSDVKYGCVLLLHGIRSNRSAMVERALFLKEHGYAVLLIDLQAHGETQGEYISFGYLESESAHYAVEYLREKQKCSQIVVLGVSLGGAASLLGRQPLEVDAYILEAVYSSIENAVENRIEMRLGVLASVISPLIYYQIPVRLGIPLQSLQPIKAIENIRAPVLFIAGTDDKHTKLVDIKKMYEAAPVPKQLWAINGVSHTDFYTFNKAEYTRIVLSFLAKQLDIDE